MSQPRHCRRALPLDTPVRLHSAQQTRLLDQHATEAGISGFELMRRAGESAFTTLRKRWPSAHRILVMCGAGNNGGDGYVVAALAKRAGLSVDVVAFKQPDDLQGEASEAYTMAVAAGVPIHEGEEGLAQPHDVDIIIDALLGTGAKGAPRGIYAKAIEWANEHGAPIFSIDLPSGVNADTGEVEQAINATLTLSFIGRKFGLYTGIAADYCGERTFDDLGIDDNVLSGVESVAHMLEPDMLKHYLPPRLPSSHKGHTGHLLVVGGRPGFGGSCIMLSESAVRVGAGLVSLATDQAHVAPALMRCPELMVRGVRSGLDIHDLLEQVRVVAIGPGLGQGAWGQGLFEQVLSSRKPVVIDADALHLLHARYSTRESRFDKRNDWVLTPHPGEAAMLLDTTPSLVQADRLSAGRELWRRYGGVIVLKGNGTLIIDGEDEHDVSLCPFGNPGMASGGMGDVLCGMIAGLLTQGLSPRDAARMGVLVHALAADQAAALQGERGLAAADLASFAHGLVNP